MTRRSDTAADRPAAPAGVPQVDFHSGVGDKLAYTCRLVRKACRSGHRVLVIGQPPTLARLDALLWTFDPQEFLPHVRWSRHDQPPAALHRAPVWLAEQADVSGVGSAAPELLVNLDADEPPTAGAFVRVFEIVAGDPEDAARGRDRWRAWKAAGASPDNHDQAARSGA